MMSNILWDSGLTKPQIDEWNNSPVKVSVICLVFNHGQYLRQCLDGFVMQKTSFRFEVIVHDDASTDNSADIIREYEEKYPEIIKPIFENENQYSKKNGSLGRIVRSAISPQSQYCAWCEGDDFWKLPHNLQTKVDWLDTHNDYSACLSNVDIFMQSPYPLRKITYVKKDCTLPIEDIILKYTFIQLTGLVLRRQLYFDCLEWGSFVVGDYPLYIFAAYSGKVRMFKERFSCYRVGVSGSYNTSLCAINKTDEKAQYRNLENTHYMVETLNKQTKFKYDDLFKNRWYYALFQFQKHTHRYCEARKTFSRIDNKIKLFGLKWTIGHYIALYLRLFDARIIK